MGPLALLSFCTSTQIQHPRPPNANDQIKSTVPTGGGILIAVASISSSAYRREAVLYIYISRLKIVVTARIDAAVTYSSNEEKNNGLLQ